ncbi:hypothetical protein ACUM5Y_01665 [Marinomonas dokdonensis]|uniref:hypothetical protein n=1 Tax=Marinomonas dokdonensis TaxID=328224 RepID=UPI004055682C
MEKFKTLDELTKIDRKHLHFVDHNGEHLNLNWLHKALSKEVLNDEVPDEIKGQFNVARNMALFTYYFYALASEVHLKTYTVIEHALRLKINPQSRMSLAKMINHAVAQRWISDAGFRHLETDELGNEWCKSMVDIIPKMRNSKAHGSTILVPDCLHHICVCTDFLNQLFPSNPVSEERQSPRIV